MPTLPAGLPRGLITGRYLFVNQDMMDEGTAPDLTVVNGDVTFTCSAKSPIHAQGLGVGLVPLKFQAVFDPEGYLVPKPAPGAAPSTPTPTVPGQLEHGLEVMASDSPSYNPTGFTYQVDFNIYEASTGSKVNIPSFPVFVPEAVWVNGIVTNPVDLPSEMPIASNGGKYYTRGAVGPAGPAIASINVVGNTLYTTLDDGTELAAAHYDVPVTPTVGIDDEGNPYFDALGVDNPIAILRDSDGVPYFL